MGFFCDGNSLAVRVQGLGLLTEAVRLLVFHPSQGRFAQDGPKWKPLEASWTISTNYPGRVLA